MQSAVIREAAGWIEGIYDRGEYWVAIASADQPVMSRLVSAMEDAGVPFRVDNGKPYDGGGVELRVDQFLTLLRQGRVQTVTVLRAQGRVTGTYDRGTFWVTYPSPSFERIRSAVEDAGVPFSEG